MRLNVRESRTVAAVSEGAARLRRGLSSADVTAVSRRIRGLASAAFADSFAGRFSRATTRAVRASWLYRWLTAEPEPDVIVIDLRETAIVGPLLGVLDWLLVRALTYGEGSVLSVVGDRVIDALRARPIQAVSTVVLAAVLANLALVIGTGSPTARAVGVRLLVMSLALAGTRLTYTAEELASTRIFGVVVALLEPPEPPETPKEREDER